MKQIKKIYQGEKGEYFFLIDPQFKDYEIEVVKVFNKKKNGRRK